MCPRQQVADMDRGRASGAAVCTSDGRVLVMGGKARSQRAERCCDELGFPTVPETHTKWYPAQL